MIGNKWNEKCWKQMKRKMQDIPATKEVHKMYVNVYVYVHIYVYTCLYIRKDHKQWTYVQNMNENTCNYYKWYTDNTWYSAIYMLCTICVRPYVRLHTYIHICISYDVHHMCSSLCTSIYVLCNIYIYMYICICIYVYVWSSICTSIYIYIYTYIYVHHMLCVICVQPYLHLREYKHIFTWYVWRYMGTSMSTSTWIRVYAYISYVVHHIGMSTCMYTSICKQIYISYGQHHMCMSICMYT